VCWWRFVYSLLLLVWLLSSCRGLRSSWQSAVVCVGGGSVYSLLLLLWLLSSCMGLRNS
jgi:hypothetical protein